MIQTRKNHQSLTQQAVQEITQQGLQLTLPTWVKNRQIRDPSMLILADAMLKNWPKNNRIYQVEIRSQWDIRRWIQAIKTGEIIISVHTILMYLETTRQWSDVPPMKNSIHSLCKAIRNHSSTDDPRMFVATLLPKITGSPLWTPICNSNFTQQQAVRSVGRAMGKVFELSIHEHFILHNGKVIRPVYRYFAGDGSLSALGCMVFWECALREADMKTYWFK